MSSIFAQFDAITSNYLLRAKSAAQEVSKMVLIEIGARLIDRSPVGNPALWKEQPPHPGINYIPGRFKNNWHLSVDQLSTDIFYASDKTGDAANQRIRAAIPRFPLGHTYYFNNNLPYAKKLEDGWSSQAPFGMVMLTELEFPQIVRDAEIRYSNGEKAPNKS